MVNYDPDLPRKKFAWNMNFAINSIDEYCEKIEHLMIDIGNILVELEMKDELKDLQEYTGSLMENAWNVRDKLRNVLEKPDWKNSLDDLSSTFDLEGEEENIVSSWCEWIADNNIDINKAHKLYEKMTKLVQSMDYLFLQGPNKPIDDLSVIPANRRMVGKLMNDACIKRADVVRDVWCTLAQCKAIMNIAIEKQNSLKRKHDEVELDGYPESLESDEKRARTESF